MNGKSRVIVIVLIAVLLLSGSFFAINGFRLTPIQAVKACPLIKGDYKVFGEVDRGWITVYLLETQDGIKTAMVERSGLLWRCLATTFFYDDIIKNDSVKTVGWASSYERSGQITVFAVQTNDPNVKYIEAGTASDRQRKDIALNETIIFEWDKMVQNKDLNAIAVDQDNTQLYKYEYNPAHPNLTDQKELKWYSLS